MIKNVFFEKKININDQKRFFEKTINAFQDLNDVFFIFCEKQKPNNILREHSKTKRVYINDTNSNNNQRKKQTRRTY